MPRQPGPDWFLPEWMDTLQVSQADLMRRTGWSKATTNDVYHGRTDYYRVILNQVADALSVRPFELLMHPDEAMALRQVRQEALRVADATVKLDAEAAEVRGLRRAS